MVFLWSFVMGFAGYFATRVDDTIALAGILDTKVARFLVSTGIFIATALEIYILLYMAKKLNHIKNRRFYSGGTLVALGILSLFNYFNIFVI
ncbi:MAG: hypothetical protein QW331_03210 [Candidatus Woesearchaeota archaeon]